MGPYDPQPYHGPCDILIDPDSDTRKCSRPTGGHTILHRPICDDCWLAVSDETVDRTPRQVPILGGLDNSDA